MEKKAQKADFKTIELFFTQSWSHLVKGTSGISWLNRAELGFNVSISLVLIHEKNQHMTFKKEFSKSFDLAAFYKKYTNQLEIFKLFLRHI